MCGRVERYIDCWGNALLLSSVDSGAAPMPEGLVSVPLTPDAGFAGILRLAVAVRCGDDENPAQTITLRDTGDATVVLACLLDADEVVQRWLELWIQTPDGDQQQVEGCLQQMTNPLFDQRWAQLGEALREMDPTLRIATGWETQPPPPLMLDIQNRRAKPLTDRHTDQPWRLCCDDDLLGSHGLARYSESVHRYLHLTDAEQPRFVALTPDAPMSEKTVAISDVLAEHAELTPLNPWCGLMLARPLYPLTYEHILEVLNGVEWRGLVAGRMPLDLDRAVQALAGDGASYTLGDGKLILEARGAAGRMIETLHLKLRLVNDAISQVHRFTRHTQRPLLNLRPTHFSVRLGAVASGLPSLWTMAAHLSEPGQAARLKVPHCDTEYFIPLRERRTSIYQPDANIQRLAGEGSVRLRDLLADDPGGMVIDGTLQTAERVATASYDLVWLNLPMPDGGLRLFGRIDRATAMATGEFRFRSLPQQMTDAQAKWVCEVQGVPLRRVRFDVLPQLSSPCDLYALGVIAVQTLCTNEDVSLPVALDTVLSLAQQVAVSHDASASLSLRIQALFDEDERWLASLGPQFLLNETITPGAAFDLVPPSLWWDVLAWLVRFFPGVGPDSVCKDLADARAGGLHRIYEPVLEQANDLLRQSRSLIVVDWQENREMASVIRQMRYGATV